MVGDDILRHDGNIKKFIIAFLTFYILLAVTVQLFNPNYFRGIVKQIVFSNAPAGKYILSNNSHNVDSGFIVGNILGGSPVISYIDSRQTPVDDETKQYDIIKNQESEQETTESETETETKKSTQKKENSDKKVSNTLNVFSKPKITGIQYSIDKLSDFDFLVNNFYTVSASTVVYKSDLNPSVLMKKDMTMKQDNRKPQILIYHTHSQERFANSVDGKKDMSIVGVGDYLTKILSEQFGYNVIHLSDKFDMMEGHLDRHKAYDYSYDKISQVIADNPTIELVIDLHRDGVDESLHFVTEVNGKPTAKIMFFNGLSRLATIGEIDYLHNPYREDNLALSLQMKMNAEAYYPGFTRKNYLHAYEYNLSLRPKSMLIEAGAQTNTFEEELNAMEPLAVLINMTLGNKQNKS